MTEWPEPTGEQLDRVLGRLGDQQHRRYFFERLENPRWLRHLKDRGVFAAPPRPWIDAEGQTRLPPWPEAGYLARMAPHEPELAVEIVSTARSTTDSLVHQEFIEVALAVPADLSARLAPLVRQWLNSPSADWLSPHRLAELVAHLARGGEVTAAHRLATSLILMRADAGSPARRGGRQHTRATKDVSTWLEPYAYADVLGTMLPDLVAAEGLQALELVNNQLETWLRHGGQGTVADRRDYSFIWRPSITAHEQNLGGTVEDALIDAARDTAQLLLGHPKIQVEDIVSAFERRSWTLFRRLALNLLAELLSARHDGDPKVLDLAHERVLSSENLNDLGLIHEYSMLTRALLPILDEDAVQAWAALIEAGPVIDEAALRARLRAGLEARGEPEPGTDQTHDEAKASAQHPLLTEVEPPAKSIAPDPVEAILDEQVERHHEIWRRNRLGAVRAALPPFLRNRYDELARRWGEAEHSDFAAYMTTGWGSTSTSPLTRDELSALDIDELIVYLQRWRPDPNQWPPRASIEGLARELVEVVMSDPSRFAERAEDFAGSGPSFARAALQGLQGALRAGRQFPWPSVVTLCSLVAAHVDDGTEPVAEHYEEDPSWRWAQQEAASLLLMGLDSGPGELPISLSGQVLATLARLVESPDPTSDHEERYGGDNMDPATLALNSTRGQAVHGLVAYAAWHSRHHPTQGPEEVRTAKDATANLEAPLRDGLEVLDRHLDAALDPSPAVRSVYGQHFPVLLHVAPEWARLRTAQIFGSGLPLDEQQKAAAAAFLAFNRPSAPLLDALRPQYATWVQALATNTFDYQPFHSPESTPEQLAAHLLLLYIWGRLEVETGLLADLFELAPLEVRRKALANVGWQLSRTEQAIPEDLLARLQALWETRRRAAIEATQHGRSEDANPASELAAFGSWFRSGRFDPQWGLNELLLVVDHIGTFERLDVDVTEQLAQTAQTDPDVALRIYDRLVRAARQGWYFSEVAREGYPVLAVALRNDRQQLVARATQLLNELGRWGLANARESVQAILSRWDNEQG